VTKVSVVSSTKCGNDKKWLKNECYAKLPLHAAKFNSMKNDHDKPCQNMKSVPSISFQRALLLLLETKFQYYQGL